MNVDNVENAYPLTSAQLGMLYHTLSSPDSDVYMAYVVMTVKGALDIELFKKSWDHTYQRHESLRAGFLWDGLDEPLQVIFKQCPLSWQIDYLPADGSIVTTEDISRAVLDERLRKVDLSNAPLSRLRLIQIQQDEWTLIWAVHHLVVDGWCTPIILSDVVRHYGNQQSGVAASCEKSRPFSEHVQWLMQQDKTRAENHWREFLNDVKPTAIRLEPFSEERVAPDTTKQAWHVPQREIVLSSIQTRALDDFCKANRLTLSTVVHCAWGLVVGQYANTHKPVFGTTTSGRQSGLAGVENAVGLYLNTIPACLEISDRSVLEAMQDFQATVYRNNSYEYLSLADIQKLVPRTDNQALFDSIVVLESHSGDEKFTAPGADLAISDINYTTHSNYPLALLVIPGNELLLRLVYDETLFSVACVEEILSLTDKLLQALQHAPPNTSMLTLHEQVMQDVLMPRCIGDAPVNNEHQTLHGWIEAYCDSQPDSIAVVAAGKSWTYEQLDQRANQIARSIRNNLYGDEELIGVALPRSFEQVAAVLGVLKSGLGYVPLNPAHPVAQLNKIIREAGINVIVCGEDHQTALQELNVQILTIEETTASSKKRFPGGKQSADSLAYVMYTSGSTGAPKGVMVSHDNVIYSTQARMDYYNSEAPTFLLLSTMTFDSSVAGLYWTLCSGGTLVLPEADEEKDLARVGQLIEQYQVTHTLCLPSLYRLMLKYINTEQLRSLYTVIVAGEQCTTDLEQEHQSHLPDCRLYNEYGPTEATVWSSVTELGQTASLSITIGRPIGNSVVMILGESGQLCPSRVEGELVIGGRGVAQGYYRQVTLAAERFVDNPVDTTHYPKVFKTGDLGYWNADGEIVFTGRADRQLKIRGNRIEPAEIESVLMSLSEVTDAGVVGISMSSTAVTKQGDSWTQNQILRALETMGPELANSLLSQLELAEANVPDSFVNESIPIGSQTPAPSTTGNYS